MATLDIQEIVSDLDGVEVTAWRSRSVDAVWPLVSFDGIVVQVRGENRRARY